MCRIETLLKVLLGKERIDEEVKEWDEEEDEESVDGLHLVGLDDVAANLPVHAGGLKCPTRSLCKWSIEIKNPEQPT